MIIESRCRNWDTQGDRFPIPFLHSRHWMTSTEIVDDPKTPDWTRQSIRRKTGLTKRCSHRSSGRSLLIRALLGKGRTYIINAIPTRTVHRMRNALTRVRVGDLGVNRRVAGCEWRVARVNLRTSRINVKFPGDRNEEIAATLGTSQINVNWPVRAASRSEEEKEGVNAPKLGLIRHTSRSVRNTQRRSERNLRYSRFAGLKARQ